MKRAITITLLLLFTLSITAKGQYIPELSPVDVYGNFQDKGFSVERDLGSEYGNFWTVKGRQGSIKYTIEINSDDVNKVESIRATARNVNYSDKQVKQFLQYTSSVLFLYNDRNRSSLNNWIDSNYNKEEATTTVGNVEVKIMAPSEIMRILKISAN